MQIKTVGVLGCGLMGAGIAQVAAASGYRTIVREVNQALLDKGLGRIRKFLDDGVAKGKVTPEQRVLPGNLREQIRSNGPTVALPGQSAF